jgi:hypothetical protein
MADRATAHAAHARADSAGALSSHPCVDQRSGERSTDPGPVLRRFRFDASLSGIMFGENAVIAAGVGAQLGCGMSCRVACDPGVSDFLMAC